MDANKSTEAPHAWKGCYNVFDHLNLAVSCDRASAADFLQTWPNSHILKSLGGPPRRRICGMLPVWSDPDDIDNWVVSPCDADWVFGGNITREIGHYFIQENHRLSLPTYVQYLHSSTRQLLHSRRPR